MSKKIEFSNEEILNIINLYLSGLSCDKISSIYNTNKTTINRLLKEKKILRPGYSNGIKINLTEEQKNNIRILYLNENKNIFEIGKILNLNKSFISKYLAQNGFRRTKSQATSISRKGWVYSEETRNKISTSNKKYIATGKRPQRGGICKTYLIENLKCQGTYEKYYIERIINNNLKRPSNGRTIKTPYGSYRPDFEFINSLIEIKSDYTYEILIGKRENPFTKKISTSQYENIKWVNKNIKPVHILIVDKKNNKIIKKEII